MDCMLLYNGGSCVVIGEGLFMSLLVGGPTVSTPRFTTCPYKWGANCVITPTVSRYYNVSIYVGGLLCRYPEVYQYYNMSIYVNKSS